MRESDAALIDEFIDALWLADGLSKNTLASYRSDLALFSGWLESQSARSLCAPGIPLRGPASADFHGYANSIRAWPQWHYFKK